MCYAPDTSRCTDARPDEGGTVQPAQEQYDVGVLIGRFQVHDLHEGHRDLISYVTKRHEKVIVFLGVSPLPVSSSNPLDFEARKQMILKDFPSVNVLYAADLPSDAQWSRALDKQISHIVMPNQSVVLYGGRDSFIAHYEGHYPTQELLQESFYSGSEVRKQIARSRAKASPEFRAGVIWASQARFPTAFQTVDVAILNEDRTKLLLGRKSTDKLFRFPGGFSDPRSETLEQDAKREAFEETGVEIGDVEYIYSTVVDDWRYANEQDCIKTALFTAKYLHGRPAPSDDLDGEVAWFDFGYHNVNYALDKQIVPVHRPLMKILRAHTIQRGA